MGDRGASVECASELSQPVFKKSCGNLGAAYFEDR
jgi:hypothetical protein